MRHRGTNAIGPGAAIRGARRGERRAAQLLGVKAERMLLRRILARRQSAGNGLGGKFIAEAGLVQNLIGHVFTSLHKRPALSAMFGLMHGLVDLIETAHGKKQLVQLVHLHRSVTALHPARNHGSRNGPPITFLHSPCELMRPLPYTLISPSLSNHAELDRVPEEPAQLLQHRRIRNAMRTRGRNAPGNRQTPRCACMGTWPNTS